MLLKVQQSEALQLPVSSSSFYNLSRGGKDLLCVSEDKRHRGEVHCSGGLHRCPAGALLHIECAAASSLCE